MLSQGLVIAAFSLYVACVHLIGGQGEVVSPLENAKIRAFSRSTLFVTWHIVSVALVATAAMLVYLTSHPNGAVRALLAVQTAAAALLFLGRAQTAHGAGFALPQWILLGPLALSIAFPAVSGALILLGLSALHVAWMLGVSFPSPSARAAPSYVVGWREGAKMPSRMITFVVALVLAFMAATAVRGPRLAIIAIACVFLGRGAFGFVESRVRPRIVGTPYRALSRLFYSPLCLFVGALLLSGNVT